VGLEGLIQRLSSHNQESSAPEKQGKG